MTNKIVLVCKGKEVISKEYGCKSNKGAKIHRVHLAVQSFSPVLGNYVWVEI